MNLMRISNQQLKAFLLNRKLINKEQLIRIEVIADKKGKSIEEILISEKMIAENKIVELKAHILGIPFIDLKKSNINLDILKIIPEPIAREHNIVAINKNNNELEVAMVNPKDLKTIDFIKKMTDLRIKPRLASSESIREVLGQYQKNLQAEFGNKIKREIKKNSSVGIVNVLIKHAISQKSSEIHIEPGEKEVVVRYRINGILYNAMILPNQVYSGIADRIKAMSNLKVDEHYLIMPTFFGEKIVMRLLIEEEKRFTLENLGFWGETLETIHRAIKKPHGMILATGPIDCGKTTTLYTILENLNKPGVNICTIEDPIEYQIPRVNQAQVRPSIGFTFANGLRSLIRQDPDIVMVGEIRDEETANLAVNAALTGHLVLSTLHTNTAVGAIPRLIDMGVEPFLISSSVNLILAQRLARKLCQEGKEKYKLSKAQIEEMGKQIDLENLLKILKNEKIVAESAKWNDIYFYKPKPTKECLDGYKDRIGIREALEISETIKDMIVKRATADEIEIQVKKEGMLTMIEDGFVKAIQGLTSLEEILKIIKE